MQQDKSDSPIGRRLRGLEQRPLVGDPKQYVDHLVETGFTVSTIGAMNGLGFAGYPTERLPVVEGMDPSWISGVLAEAHRRGIKLICWNVYNIQDVRNVDDFQISKRYPQWRMQYIEEPGKDYGERAGMCVLSSPYLAEHAKLIQEIVRLGPDAMWFDGFYLGGIPHPIRPGCVCEHCRAQFRKDYGLDLPAEVDWSDPTFKRWVRWRNERLVGGARFMTDKIHEVAPGLPVTFNYNQWPFGTKDWPNAIPLWKTADYGVSQHAYSPDERMQWVMLGYKAQLSHDLNPDASDIWRTGRPIFDVDAEAGGKDKHELQIRLFTLAALSAGTLPWRSAHQFSDVQKRNNEELARREPTFATRKVAPIGVVLSQNTHDFWGHIPGTNNLVDYRNTILGTWLLLTEHHVPFTFVFDNELENDELTHLSTLVLPNMACVSQLQSRRIQSWVRRGGSLVVTGTTGEFDEWGEPVADNRLAPLLTGNAAESGAGTVVVFTAKPGRDYAIHRSASSGAPPTSAQLLSVLESRPRPLRIEAPKSLATSLFRVDDKTLVLHLLNASAFYRFGGDSGFAGVSAPPSAPSSDTGSDAETGAESHAAPDRPFETVPVSGARVVLDGLDIASAHALVADRDLSVAGDGSFTLPDIAEHEAVVIHTR